MNSPPAWPRRGLYLITPDEHDTRRLVARVHAALEAGPALLQYRNKPAGASLRREQARELQSLCAHFRVPLVVNDDWRLAVKIGAAGVHLGESDGALAVAREALGPAALLGASCYDQADRARLAAAEGASYLAFGAFFPSGTKPGARRAHVGLLTETASLGLPRVAIGGITPDNAGALVTAGADLVAALGSVFGAADPAAAVRAFQRCFLPHSSEPQCP